MVKLCRYIVYSCSIQKTASISWLTPALDGRTMLLSSSQMADADAADSRPSFASCKQSFFVYSPFTKSHPTAINEKNVDLLLQVLNVFCFSPTTIW